MKPYYNHILEWAKTNAKGGRVVEVGSGDAEYLVYASKELDIHGCDVREHAGKDKKRFETVSRRLVDSGLEESRYQWIQEKEPLPFEDNSAAVILSIQTLEHVSPIHHLFSEIHRVLQPGGKALHYFPTSNILVDPHCGIPFAHKFSGSLSRYLRKASMLGIGKFKAYERERGYTLDQYVSEFETYILQLCHYRSPGEYIQLSNWAGLGAKFQCPPPLPRWQWLAYVAGLFASVYLIQEKPSVNSLL